MKIYLVGLSTNHAMLALFSFSKVFGVIGSVAYLGWLLSSARTRTIVADLYRGCTIVVISGDVNPTRLLSTPTG